ncbi:MAG: helix-turn-helix transcriptional regulator [Melioribacteraceae bacterium]|nr:helix-turn-helix transcriptional regulator [Melioribacteraceae bacterium]
MKNRIKVLRAEKNLSQDELAKAIKVSRQTINAIENGKFNPSVKLAMKMAELFGTTIENIFTLEEKDK